MTRIEHGADGRVTGVVYRDPKGVEHRQKARIVCVACNSIETARLLLLSESSKFPQGLANSHDQVGRNYSRHTGGFCWGIFDKDKPVHMWRGATLAGIIEDENINDPRRGFVGGYHLEMVARWNCPPIRWWACPTCGAATSRTSWRATGALRACSSMARTCRARRIASP